jgi:hypothetical protein
MTRFIVDGLVLAGRSLRLRALRSAALVVAVLAIVSGACTPAPTVPSRGDDVPSMMVRAGTVARWALDDGWRVSPVLAAAEGATRVGALVQVEPGSTVALQARVVDDTADATTGPWRPLAVVWRDDVHGDDGQFVARVDLGGIARAVQLRVAAADLARLRTLTFEAVVPEVQTPVAPGATARGDEGIVASPAPSTSQAVLDGYEPRSAWGARASRNCSANASKTRVTIHHTVSPLNADGTRDEFAAAVRGIQAFHMNSRDYCDVGYHFLVTADGTVWEGRPADRLGAHAGGQNTNNLGISFIGCFHPTADCDGLGGTTPPQEMIDGAGAFVGRVSRHYGITLSFGSTFFGHRDNPGQATSCPGDDLHDRLDEIEAIAEGGAPPPATTGRVQGAVWNRAITDDVAQASALGARLPGALVTATQGATTVASATARDGDAYWALDLPPGSYTLTATLDGFAPTTRSHDVAAGDVRWNSLGLAPVATAAVVRVVVVDGVTSAPLSLATVRFGADEPLVADGAGQVTTSLPPGPVTVVASAEGYVTRTEEHTLTAGTPFDLTMRLDADPSAEDPPIEEPPVDDSDALQRVVIRNAPGVRASGGCTCDARTGNGDVGALAALTSVLVLLRRRRRMALPT